MVEMAISASSMPQMDFTMPFQMSGFKANPSGARQAQGQASILH
jgi:hypothetical protein